VGAGGLAAVALLARGRGGKDSLAYGAAIVIGAVVALSLAPG